MTVMWNYISPANLLTFQREAAIRLLDEQILEDHQAGYGVDVDAKLDRRLDLQRLIDQNST